MKPMDSIFAFTRRRFLVLPAGLAVLLSWPLRARRDDRLSRREAAFYRRGGPRA